MPYSHYQLKNFIPKLKFFVAFDSDGCVFDNMEVKQKACFIPMIIKHWHLEAIAKYVQETAEFVNLYSIWRGGNRFPALVRIFDLLLERPEVIKQGGFWPDIAPLREFVNSGDALSNPSLADWYQRTQHPVFKEVLEWSVIVNQLVAEKVKDIRPFPYIREIFEKLCRVADIIVCSSTTVGTLQQEWQTNHLDRYVRLIAGQEMGTKKEHLESVARGRYDPDKILMIGDTPGDKKAADSIGALFFPIYPGHEARSWEIFYQEALDRFLNGTFAGEYQSALIAKFDKLLPERPSWEI
ncbi:HAD family hydrolase [candidate division KSB1 bacterium]|nr:HAD family hydrolase [candidate division KSB1 bacterium]